MTWIVPKIWEGGDCFILGGGLSLPKVFGVPDHIIQRVLRGELSPAAYSPYMEALHDKHVIGVNAAFLLGNWVDFLFFGDRSFYTRYHHDLLKFPGVKITSCGLNHEKIKSLAKAGPVYGITPRPNQISWNNNSGGAAVNLAYHLGAKRIYLLGFDMNFVDGKTHWHGIYDPKPSGRAAQSFSNHLQCFKGIARDAKIRGVEIYNCSPTSAITHFPRVDIYDVVERPLNVTMICTVYNEAQYLPGVIRYWKNQGVNVYVIDNYSDDGTWEWMTKNGIPGHRFDTDGSFDLTALQREMERTLKKLNPDWVIYGAADLYYSFDRPVKQVIREAIKSGHNQISVPCWSAMNTGEPEKRPLPGNYFHCTVSKRNLTMISRYESNMEFIADHISINSPRPKIVPGIVINFGGCKPGWEQDKKLQRRQKAWEKGLNKNYGVHYREGVKRNWVYDAGELTDIRNCFEFRFYQNILEML